MLLSHGMMSSPESHAWPSHVHARLSPMQCSSCSGEEGSRGRFGADMANGWPFYSLSNPPIHFPPALCSPEEGLL